jgi:predicted benzoate:H+ symporter BenE
MSKLSVLLANWSIMRIIRLALSLFIATQAIQNHDGFAGIIAIFLFYQVATNTGCCGVNGCATPRQEETDKELIFEEVKNV